jgi:hypothetical protein
LKLNHQSKTRNRKNIYPPLRTIYENANPQIVPSEDWSYLHYYHHITDTYASDIQIITYTG